MKKISSFLLSLIVSMGSLPLYADDVYVPTEGNANGASDEALTKYVKNLGEYFGYDLEQPFSPVQPFLLTVTSSWTKMGEVMLKTFFGSIPVNTYYKPFSSQSNFAAFNKQANATFQDYRSNTGEGSSSGSIGVLEGFDQKDYQEDPVNQAILNILATPDYDVCSDTDNCVNQGQVMYTVLQDILKASNNKGVLPGENSYFSYDNSGQFLSQLNVNTLIAPLLYSTEGSSSGNGMPAGNQLQQAQDFIRYATAAVLPIETMSAKDYSALWSKAYQSQEGQSEEVIKSIKNAQKDLANYLLSLRVYAAQSSVGISNLYQIMAKRMPQTQTASSGAGTSSVTSSEAANEFQAATWRLFNPSKSANEQWARQLDAASAATIQKEIAVLLSEINYQLYLNRQQEERVLLTNSLMLLQALSQNRPDASPEHAGTPASTAASATTE
ncbi:MAG TPA: hypothetical protein VHD33_00480 [Legionellaceae bacterium]|nr:hypothetical protein [Legionellaceae bacterium]